MCWFFLLAALIGLPILTVLVSGLVFYVQYCNSPEKQWQDRVFGLLAAARRRAADENRELRRIASDHQAKARALSEDAFQSYLADIPVRELEAYAGIGPATVAKLRGAGYTDLAALRNARPNINGLGAKRLADIDSAVRDLFHKARTAFDAGTCRQAQALPGHLQQLASEYAGRESRARARLRASEEVAERLREPEAAARGVTFWRWFRPRLEEKLAPPEVMEAPLPDLEVAVRNAEGRAGQPKGARHPRTPASRVSDMVAHPAGSGASPAAAPRNSAVPHVRTHDPVRASLPGWVAEMSEDSHLFLMELTIQFVLAAARADGPVTAVERDLIRGHLRQRFSYDRALLNRAEALCAHYESAAIDLERCLLQINEKFTPAHRTALLEFAGRIVAVSGNGTLAGATFLMALARQLGVPSVALALPKPPAKPAALPSSAARPSPTVLPAAPPRPAAARVAAAPAAARPPAAAAAPAFRPAVATPPAPVRAVAPIAFPALGPAVDAWLALLEIPPDTSLSADLVRRQWNLLSERLAPDNVASMGPEFVKLAETRLATLRRAAEALLGPLGEKLEIKTPQPPARGLRDNPDLDEVFGGL